MTTFRPFCRTSLRHTGVKMEKPSRLLSHHLLLKNRVYEVTLNCAQLTWIKKQRVSRTLQKSCKVVREADVEGRSKTSGRWQRLSRRPAEGYPYAFTAGRPRHLLAYINPHGGRRRGEADLLFSRASVSTSVIVTERANHARDHLKTDADLKNYDGVVCVGGDSMFSEVLHGLVSRTPGVDQNRREQSADVRSRCGVDGLRLRRDRGRERPRDLRPCTPSWVRRPPAGSDSDSVDGRLFTGDSQPLEALLRYSVSLPGYGFCGDVLTDSERRRWMGPVRYDVSGLKTFLAHNYYEGTVSFPPATDVAGSPRDKTTCRAGCSRCLKDSQAYGTGNCVRGRDQSGDWRVIRGKFLAVNAVSMSCVTPEPWGTVPLRSPGRRHHRPQPGPQVLQSHTSSHDQECTVS